MKKTLVAHTLLLLLTAVLLLPACERVDPVAETMAGRSLQARMEGENGNIIGHGGGPCECGPACSTFGIAPTMLPLPSQNPEAYDFAVSLRKTSECNGSLLDASTCHYTGERYEFSFPGDPHLNNFVSLSYFEKIHAYDLLNDEIQAFEGSTGSGLFVNYPADIYFKWKTDFEWIGTPPESDLRAGGICIIGIITDPCFPCPGNGRPIPPIVPHRIR